MKEHGTFCVFAFIVSLNKLFCVAIATHNFFARSGEEFFQGGCVMAAFAELCEKEGYISFVVIFMTVL